MTIKLEQTHVWRGNRPVLKDICLGFERGRVTAILGRNGAGKSTLLATLAGDLQPDQGTVTMDHLRLVLPAHELARSRALMMQQSEALFNLSVRQAIQVGLYAFGELPESVGREIVLLAAQQAALQRDLDGPITALSVGQQQRVHFARAMAQALAGREVLGKAWLLLDEPVASQDPWQQQRLMSVCRDWVRDPACGVVVVLHDLSLALQWCDEAILIDEGAVLAAGSVADVLSVPLIQQAFGTDLAVSVVRDPVPGILTQLVANGRDKTALARQKLM
jgi:iron complex transport system ATP-binding protein